MYYFFQKCTQRKQHTNIFNSKCYLDFPTTLIASTVNVVAPLSCLETVLVLKLLTNCKHDRVTQDQFTNRVFISLTTINLLTLYDVTPTPGIVIEGLDLNKNPEFNFGSHNRYSSHPSIEARPVRGFVLPYSIKQCCVLRIATGHKPFLSRAVPMRVKDLTYL